MPGIGSQYVLAVANRQQVVFPHDAQYSLVIDRHALAMQIHRDPPVAVAATVRQDHLLDCFPAPVVTGPADAGQLAHPFYT